MLPSTLSALPRSAVGVAVRLISTTKPDNAALATQMPAEEEAPSKYNKTFYHKDMKMEVAPAHERKAKPSAGTDLKFGHFYADHMVEVDWDDVRGWHKPGLHKMRNLSLHPGAKVLHYASELFEGMKAYRGIDNRIRLFRPDMNMARMNRTASRTALPEFDSNELIKMIVDLVSVDESWVPESQTSSLYIRPAMIGTDKTLGVGFAKDAKLFVLTGPVGSYFSSGFKPVTLLADSQYVRAFPGGVGAYKMGCNYAPTIGVAREAEAKGCQQVLWLSGENEEVTEVGTMNIFVFWKNEQGELELVTPSLSKGLILPGVTRDSLLTLGKSYGEFKVSERDFTMEDIRRAVKEKRLLQIFGAGTACVVSPVGKILYHNRATKSYEELQIPTMTSTPNLMQRFYDHIIDIQYGRQDYPGWVVEVPSQQ